MFFTSYCKLLYRCFNSNNTKLDLTSYETLGSIGEMKLLIKFYLYLIILFELQNLFKVPMGNCFFVISGNYIYL